MKLSSALQPLPPIAGGTEGISVTPLRVVDGDTIVVRINRIAARDHAGESRPREHVVVRFRPSADDATEGMLTIVRGRTAIELRPGTQVRVRLRGIDAPELRQPGGAEAKAALTKLLFREPAPDTRALGSRPPPGMGGTAQLWVEDLDRHGRLVALVWTHDASDVGGAMVRLGHAWVYDQYAPVPNTYYLTEQEARDARIGLWAESDPQPPWEWRRERRINKGLGCDRCGAQMAAWHSEGALEQYCDNCVRVKELQR